MHNNFQKWSMISYRAGTSTWKIDPVQADTGVARIIHWTFDTNIRYRLNLLSAQHKRVDLITVIENECVECRWYLALYKYKSDQWKFRQLI
jgi:hypothetical protein